MDKADKITNIVLEIMLPEGYKNPCKKYINHKMVYI